MNSSIQIKMSESRSTVTSSGNLQQSKKLTRSYVVTTQNGKEYRRNAKHIIASNSLRLEGPMTEPENSYVPLQQPRVFTQRTPTKRGEKRKTQEQIKSAKVQKGFVRNGEGKPLNFDAFCTTLN